MGRMTGDAGMKPMQKFRLLVLALCSPYFLALLYRLVGHPRPANWFNPLCLFYSVGAVTSAHIYLLRHPELRPSPEEKARRLAATNPRKATLQVMVFLAVSLAVLSTFLFFRPQPTLKSRLCAGFTTRPRVMEHVSRSGMGWCCPHLSGIPPSLSGIGAERKAKLNRSTPGVLNG